MSRQSSPALPAVGDADHILGPDSSRLTLVEYGDLGCPFCYQAKRPVRSLLERFEGVQLIWRHLPDAELHPGADLAAELSELAAVHGRFWEAHELLLAGRDKFSREDLLSAAKELELDADETVATLDGRTFRARVLADIEGGRRAGVHGTPTFFIDGERLEGSWRRLAEIVPARLQGSRH